MTTGNSTQVAIESVTRTRGTASQYTINLQPKVQHVYRLSLKSFNGFIHPWSIPDPVTYRITFITYINNTGTVGSTTHYDCYIPAGNFSLPALFEVLNTDVSPVRFKYSEYNGKVTIEKVGFDTLQASERARIEGGTLNSAGERLINRQMGFPFGWNIPTSLLAIQSVEPVEKQYYPTSLLVAFDTFPSKTVSSAGIIGEFCIPLKPQNYNSVNGRLTWTENTDHPIEIICYAENIDNLGVRIGDSIRGSPYRFIGEHNMIIEFDHTNVNTKVF